MPNLLALGWGYSVAPLGHQLLTEGWGVTGTTRSPEKAAELVKSGVTPLIWTAPDPLPAEEVSKADVIVISLAPDEEGCPAFAALPQQALKPDVKIIYLSSSGVYGDHDGAWVDEETPCDPQTDRGRKRLKAEAQWQSLGGIICRLAGIYGPGRNAIESLQGRTRGAKAGLSQRVIKPGQVFNRIHRDDIVKGLNALLHADNPPQIVNFSDDEPSPPQDVIAYAAKLLKVDPPPEIPFEEAELSPMGRSFYQDNKRLRNDRLKTLMGPLTYSTYREGLKALLSLPK
ncbi:MAG: SDR family oxidoreductase [Pseudomonadota bacterium]